MIGQRRILEARIALASEVGEGAVEVEGAPSAAQGAPPEEILAGGAIAFAGSGTGRLLAFAVQVAVGRILGPSLYGSYVAGLAVVRLALPGGIVGLNSAIVRFGAIHSSRSDISRLKGAILSAFTISALVSGAISLVLYLLANTLAVSVFKDPFAEPVLRAIAVAIPFLAATELAAAAAQSVRKIHIQQLAGRIARPAIQLALVGLVVFLGWGLIEIAWSYTAASILAAGLAVALVIRVFPHLRRNVRPTFEVRQLTRFSAPVFLSSLLFMLLSNVDRLMLGYFQPSGELGAYNAAATFAQTMPLVLTAFTPISVSWMAELHYGGKSEDLEALYRSVTRWTLMLTLPLFFVFVFARQPVMLIFGNAYVPASSILAVLAIGQLINAATGPVGKLMEMSGKQDINVISLCVVLALNIALNILLIPPLAGLGAAIATSFSTSLVFILLLRIAGRQLRLRLVDWSLAPIILAGVISVAAGVGLSQLLEPMMGVILKGVVTSAAACVAFGGQLLLYGIPDADRHLASKVLSLLRAKLRSTLTA